VCPLSTAAAATAALGSSPMATCGKKRDRNEAEAVVDAVLTPELRCCERRRSCDGGCGDSWAAATRMLAVRRGDKRYDVCSVPIRSCSEADQVCRELSLCCWLSMSGTSSEDTVVAVAALSEPSAVVSSAPSTARIGNVDGSEADCKKDAAHGSTPSETDAG
jgi:hypothetical protein